MSNYNINHAQNIKLSSNSQNIKFFSICFDWIESIVQAVIIVVFLMSSVFRTVNISGDSMRNTLYNNDKVIIRLWDYTPKCGDIVVIKCGNKLDSPIIKRIIATEGQKLNIDFNQGTVSVDGQRIEEPYIKERMWLRGDADIPDIIPNGYCFVMGDNRNNSTDSRFEEVGLIPYSNIVGKATYIIFPLDRMGRIS